MIADRNNKAEQDCPADEAAPRAHDAPKSEVAEQEDADRTSSAEFAGTGDEGMEALRKALDESRRELDRHREAMLRMQAEMDNQRKRLARESEKSRRFALERIMKDLLQVRDSLERGLEVDDDTVTVESLREGKALTLRMLSKVMQDHGLEVIDPEGEPFNPEFHEAMTMAPSAEHPENTVLKVLQKGFRLNDRLIRPAMVVVSKKPD